MSHKHHNHSTNISASLLWSTVLNFSISIIQIIGGVLSNSLSLISDSVHNLGDATAIFGAYYANKIGKRKPTDSKTYGYKRAEIVAAFINSLALLIISSYLFIEAIKRFSSPQHVNGNLMLIVAIAGLGINVVSVLILSNKRKGNLNVKAAYLHLLSDTYSSVAVIIGAIAIKYFDAFWIDPIITVLVNILIFKHTYHVLKESLNILMQSVPDATKIKEIHEFTSKFNWIANIHHVHIWTMDGQKNFMECHVEFSENKTIKEAQALLNQLSNELEHQFNISHTTFQPEYDSKHLSNTHCCSE